MLDECAQTNIPGRTHGLTLTITNRVKQAPGPKLSTERGEEAQEEKE